MLNAKFLNWGLMMTYATILVAGFVISAFFLAFYWSVGLISRVEPLAADYGQNLSGYVYQYPLSEQVVASVLRDQGGRFVPKPEQQTNPLPTITPSTATKILETGTLQPSAILQPSNTLPSSSSSPTRTPSMTPSKTATATGSAVTTSIPTPIAATSTSKPKPNHTSTATSKPRPSATQAPPTQPPPTQPPPTQPPPTRPPAPTATEESYPPPRPTDPPYP